MASFAAFGNDAYSETIVLATVVVAILTFDHGRHFRKESSSFRNNLHFEALLFVVVVGIGSTNASLLVDH